VPDFDARFLFGTATSATQIEGGCRNTDWYEFAAAGGAHGDSLEVACDHWVRYREDVELSARLGLNAQRLSLEWARIEPEDGRFDEHALERYRSEVAALVDAGIEPMVTLHHFSFPLWLARRGGVLAPDMPQRLETFARRVGRALGRSVRTWITINEPNVLAAQGYLFGVWPPAKRQPAHLPKVILQLRKAHRLAYRALHEFIPNARVGLAHHLRVATPKTQSLLDRAGASLLDFVFNRLFLDLPQDFIGLNYYSRDLVRFAPDRPRDLFLERSVDPNSDVSDLGWEIYPEGLGQLLRELAARKLPIFITENGIADAADTLRPGFLLSHLGQVARAVKEGIDVRGYYHWSLLDNFEWSEGYTPRFGLYALDYATQTRRLRASGDLYGQVARTRSCG